MRSTTVEGRTPGKGERTVMRPQGINAPGTRYLVFQRHNGQLSKCETAVYLTAHTGV